MVSRARDYTKQERSGNLEEVASLTRWKIRGNKKRNKTRHGSKKTKGGKLKKEMHQNSPLGL